MKIKILALILARKNSKRLPKKNLRKIGKKTLVEWSIESAKNIIGIVDILVSTDDEKIIKIAKKNGAIAPWLRPKHLSHDNTSSEDTALHALNWYEKNISKINGLLLLQPTTPFRSKKFLRKAIQIFKKNNKKTIVSVSKILNGKKFKKSIINGSFYLTSPKRFRKNKNFEKKNFYPILIKKKQECVDINTKKDLNLAIKYYKKDLSNHR